MLDALSGARPFVVAEGHKGAAVAQATGTAIYFPIGGDAQLAYNRLAFAQKTRWPALITEYRNS